MGLVRTSSPTADIMRDYRRQEAERHEERLKEYIERFRQAGIHVSGDHYGATAVVIRFDDIERVLSFVEGPHSATMGPPRRNPDDPTFP